MWFEYFTERIGAPAVFEALVSGPRHVDAVRRGLGRDAREDEARRERASDGDGGKGMPDTTPTKFLLHDRAVTPRAPSNAYVRRWPTTSMRPR
jgi:hypothetical protein